MKHARAALFSLCLLFGFGGVTADALADDYDETIKVFRDANESGRLFARAYGYAVFPNIGKGGVGIGGAYGKGRVYKNGVYVGDTSMKQLTIGLQLGGQAYSQIIFFENESAFTKFTSGNFEFGAQAQAVAITAGASAAVGTTGNSASASATREQATATADYQDGMATFTVARGGLMYEATIGGQKFRYKARR